MIQSVKNQNNRKGSPWGYELKKRLLLLCGVLPVFDDLKYRLQRTRSDVLFISRSYHRLKCHKVVVISRTTIYNKAKVVSWIFD